MSQIFANMAHFSEWRTRLDIDNTPQQGYLDEEYYQYRFIKPSVACIANFHHTPTEIWRPKLGVKRSKESVLVSISVFKINSEIQSIGDPAKLFVNVRFGWLAVLQDDISPMSAFPKSGR